MISIILPIYNVEEYLPSCLESIIKQTYTDFEVIGIVDGSKDNSLSVLEKYAKEDKRIKIINRKENKGLLASRCEGLEHSKGEYIMFCDSDDWLDHKMLEKMKTVLEDTNSDYVKCGFVREYDEKKSELVKITDTIKTFTKNQFIEHIFPNFILTARYNNIWGELIKKEILDISNINKKIAMGEDVLINCQLFKKANTITYIDDCLYHYRFNLNSMTNKADIEKLEKNFNDLIEVQKEKIYLIKGLSNELLNTYISVSTNKLLFEQSIRVALQKNIPYRAAKKIIQRRLSNDIFLTIKTKDYKQFSKKDKIIYLILKNKCVLPIYIYAKLLSIK